MDFSPRDRVFRKQRTAVCGGVVCHSYSTLRCGDEALPDDNIFMLLLALTGNIRPCALVKNYYSKRFLEILAPAKKSHFSKNGPKILQKFPT